MENESRVDRELFLKMLNERFPRVHARITEIESGLLHPEMCVVARATREAIEEARWTDVSDHFSFISEVFSRGSAEVENAVFVSYLENVLLGEKSARFLHARSMLPPALRVAMVELEEHFEMLAKHAETNIDPVEIVEA